MPITQNNAQILLDKYKKDFDQVLQGLNKKSNQNKSLFIKKLLKALNRIADLTSIEGGYSTDNAQQDLIDCFEATDESNQLPMLLSFNKFNKGYKNKLEECYREIKKLISAPPPPPPAPGVPEMQATREPEAEVMTDWSYWLRCGLLSASLVASVALCVYAASAPVILGLGLLAAVGSGLALAGTLGFFNSSETNHSNTNLGAGSVTPANMN